MGGELQFEMETPGGHGIFAFIIRLWWAIVEHYHIFRMFAKEFSTTHKRFDWRRTPNKIGSVAVITGATGGIGAEVVKKLLQCDMHVVLGCRDTVAGNNIVKSIRRKGITTGTAETLYLDLMSLNSVKQFAYKVLTRNTRVNILINNAAVKLDKYTVTVDGFEQHFQVNYLSHYLLTYLLLPRLKESGSPDKVSRIINVSSAAHYGGNVHFSDLQMSKIYSCHKAYMDSKFLQLTFSNFLDQRLQAEGCFVRSYSIHPGMVMTHLWDTLRWKWTSRFNFLNTFLFLKPEQGADTIVYTSLSAQVESKGGTYICNSEITEPHLKTYDNDTQSKLWTASCRYLDIEDDAFSYYNENAPDNDNNIQKPCCSSTDDSKRKSKRNCALSRRLKYCTDNFYFVFPFSNSRYLKGGLVFVITKVETMRSAFNFLFNYE